jgi:hypothetical protein
MVGLGGFAFTRRDPFRIGMFVLAAWVSFYLTVIAPVVRENRSYLQIVAQKSSGLGAVAGSDVAWDPISLWRQSSVLDLFYPPKRISAQRGIYMLRGDALDADGSADGESASAEFRQVIRTASLEMEVKSPVAAVDQIRALAERMGGFMLESNAGNDDSSPTASIAIRVPVSRYEETRAELKRLALHMEGEHVNASDVTKEYADKQARLRNLAAEETQYLAIMKRANTVKDTLEVSAKLTEVRGEIEKQQAEFAALAKQVQTVAIEVSLRAEADAQVFGLHWRPLYELKVAARDGLQSLANYLAVITTALFRLPAFALWLVTVIGMAGIVLRGSRWVWKKFFVAKQAG